MDIYRGARTVALLSDLDPMSLYYEQRSFLSCRSHYKLLERPMSGLSFFFHGVILETCEYFCLDFVTKNNISDRDCNILLRIGSRLPQNYIVRNSRLGGKWGPQETASNLPFQLKRGKSFWMQVLITRECFYISVNGYHFAQYEHRMPYKWLKAVDVRGDVLDVLIDQYYVSEYPYRLPGSLAHTLPLVQESSLLDWLKKDWQHNIPPEWLNIDTPTRLLTYVRRLQTQLTLPFYGRMPHNARLTEGRALRIDGRVRTLPQSFSVALQSGQDIWPQPTVSFYFSSHFSHRTQAELDKAVIMRSAYLNGVWVQREASCMYTHLRPGTVFVLVIVCRLHCYELFVNGKLLLSFKHCMRPEEVDVVNIRGDIKLWDVVIEASRAVEHIKGRKLIDRAIAIMRTKHAEQQQHIIA